MLNLARVEVGSYEFSRIRFGEGEDGTLDHGPSKRAVHGTERVLVGVMAGARVAVRSGVVGREVGGDELRGGGVDCPAEGFELAGLVGLLVQRRNNALLGDER